ncbi:hypothetical protein H4Q26_002939 [Puccinia striiformis f. sp. tritici PST-130]|nr:hypothetical protein H4Q26_002939 [Puccinia striiformis f. sp. tritici PST-130]
MSLRPNSIHSQSGLDKKESPTFSCPRLYEYMRTASPVPPPVAPFGVNQASRKVQCPSGTHGLRLQARSIPNGPTGCAEIARPTDARHPASPDVPEAFGAPEAFGTVSTAPQTVGKEFTIVKDVVQHGARKRVAKPLPHRGLIIDVRADEILHGTGGQPLQIESNFAKVCKRLKTETMPTQASASSIWLANAISYMEFSRGENKPAVCTIRRRIPVTGLTDVTSGNSRSRQSDANGYSSLSL